MMPSGNAAAQPHVVVAICTYGRPTLLPGAVAAIDLQDIRGLRDAKIEICIVDNNPGGEGVTPAARRVQSSRFDMIYVHEPRKGLAFARNAAIEAARARAATHLAFIDDDERPDPAWLSRQMAALEPARDDLVAAVGPVLPVFESHPPRWIPSEAFAALAPTAGGLAEAGYSGNCIIDLAVLERAGLAFDSRLNATGGEDTAFFGTLLRRGYKIAWAGDALVRELVPDHRMAVRWLFQRWYRTGAVEAAIAQLEQPVLQERLHSLGGHRIRLAAARPAGGQLLHTLPRRRVHIRSIR